MLPSPQSSPQPSPQPHHLRPFLPRPLSLTHTTLISFITSHSHLSCPSRSLHRIPISRAHAIPPSSLSHSTRICFSTLTDSYPTPTVHHLYPTCTPSLLQTPTCTTSMSPAERTAAPPKAAAAAAVTPLPAGVLVERAVRRRHPDHRATSTRRHPPAHARLQTASRQNTSHTQISLTLFAPSSPDVSDVTRPILRIYICIYQRIPLFHPR